MTEGLHRFYGCNDLHFLTFSCYLRRPFLTNATRCDLFLKILDRVRRRYRFVVLGYVVMPEHVHLLVSEPQRETLSTAIQALKLGFVRGVQCSSGSVVRPPRSRKIGETWAPSGPVSINDADIIVIKIHPRCSAWNSRWGAPCLAVFARHGQAERLACKKLTAHFWSNVSSAN
jgi:hypothetical protein